MNPLWMALVGWMCQVPSVGASGIDALPLRQPAVAVQDRVRQDAPVGPTLAQRVAINTASTEELQRLPGIGPRKAEWILAARGRRPFRKGADLRRIKGFGPRTIRRLEPMLDFSLPVVHNAAGTLDSTAPRSILRASLPTDGGEAP